MGITQRNLRKLKSSQPLTEEQFAKIVAEEGFTVRKQAGSGSSHVRYQNPKTREVIGRVNGKRSHVSEQHAAQFLENRTKTSKTTSQNNSSQKTEGASHVSPHLYSGFIISQNNDSKFTATHQDYEFLTLNNYPSEADLKVAIYSLSDEVDNFSDQLSALESEYTIHCYTHNERLYLKNFVEDQILATIPLKRKSPENIIQSCLNNFDVIKSNHIPGKQHLAQMKTMGEVTKTNKNKTVNGEIFETYTFTTKNEKTQQKETIEFNVHATTGDISSTDMLAVSRIYKKSIRTNLLALHGITVRHRNNDLEYKGFISGKVLKVPSLEGSAQSQEISMDEALQFSQKNTERLTAFIDSEKALIEKQLSTKPIKAAKALGIQFQSSAAYRAKKITPPTQCAAIHGKKKLYLNLIKVRLRNGNLQDIFSKHSYRELCEFMSQIKQSAPKVPVSQNNINPIAQIVKQGLKK